MPRKFKFCFHCRRTITENDIQRGLFVQTAHGMLCATCAQQFDEETAAAKKLAAAQEPFPAEPAAPPVEEMPEPVPPPEPPKESPAPQSAPMAMPQEPPIPRVAIREESQVAAPRPVMPDPPAAPERQSAATAGWATPPVHDGLPPSEPQSAGSGPPAQPLEDIREHVEAIHRTLVFEKSSPWNVMATIAQCLAIGMLILAAVNWADNPMHLLLVALIFQVMALTFFVRGK